MRTPNWIVLSLVCGCMGYAGCVGTRTGNPGAMVPDGVELAQSELARITDPKLSAADSATFGRDNRSFTFDLYGELSKESGNLFFSPYSISTALAMTYAGARTETATEMEQTLHFSLGQDTLHTAFNATDMALGKRKTELSDNNSERPQTGNGFELTLVNQAWGRKGYAFLDSYLDVLGQNYGAGLFLMDFGQSEKARTTINSWVQEQTKDRIKNLLPSGSISGSTALVLTNAIYFKASWQQTFDKSKTTPGIFHADTGEVSVDMMHNNTKLHYAAVGGVQMLSLPYVSTNVAMLLILPPEGDLALDVDTFDALQEKLSEHDVVLSLPKWSFESLNPLKESLMALGMEAAFGAADFSGMDGHGGLYISEVYHKAFVAVDEEGTEAAAATAVALNESASQPVTLTFDRPFIFAIYDKPTGQVLFFGRVAEP